MEYGKTKLIDMLTNVPREGWSRQKVKDMVDTLWRNPVLLRWSGFEYAGGTDCDISFDNSSRTFTIAPKVKMFAYYQYRNKLTYHPNYDTHEVIIDDTQGLHLIYFDADPDTKEQVLLSIMPTDSQIEDIYLHKVVVAWIYWVPGIGENPGAAIYFGESRHGSEWPSQVHWWNHKTLNSLRGEGLTITGALVDRDGSLDTHAQFNITAGTAYHSDIPIAYNAQTPASLPIFYMDSGVPVILTKTGFSIYTSGNICYTSGSGPTAAQDGYYVMYHIFATNCIINPLISAMGLSEYETIGDALSAKDYELDTIKNTFVQSNMMLIGTIVYQTSSEFGNSVQSKIVYIPSDTDEKVKYDASDPTAGYIADKIVAGTGISVAEGTGANENKLVITNTGGSSTDEKVKYDAGDPTAGYLADKIIAGTNVAIEEGTGANENKLVISANQGQQVQSDWDEDDTDSPAYILNKPPIPAAQVQSDWTQADNGAVDYIKNKPTIEANTDETVKYDASDPTAGYIADKIVAGTGISVAEGTGDNENKLVITNTGSSNDNIDVHILFEEADAMTYFCPYNMKLIAETASAAISSDANINDTFSQYDEIEITATEAGLITLTFELIES